MGTSADEAVLKWLTAVDGREIIDIAAIVGSSIRELRGGIYRSELEHLSRYYLCRQTFAAAQRDRPFAVPACAAARTGNRAFPYTCVATWWRRRTPFKHKELSGNGTSGVSGKLPGLNDRGLFDIFVAPR
jgi:hypothetical protein